MLQIKNLSVEVEGKKVLDSLDMEFEAGKNYCIVGKNGSGKSSLAMTVMGHPKYECSTGHDGGIFLLQESQTIASYLDPATTAILEEKVENLDTINLLDLNVDLRSKLGVFVAFQNIPEIKGVKLFEFLRTIYNSKRGVNETFLSFKKIIEPLLLELGIDKEFLRRDVNVGFSGGERRKIEILQLNLLKPRYIFLDEVDSGLDVDAFRNVATLLAKYNSPENSLIIITHYFQILDHISVDHVYLLEAGKIIWQGGVELAKKIQQDGFGDTRFD